MLIKTGLITKLKHPISETSNYAILDSTLDVVEQNVEMCANESMTTSNVNATTFQGTIQYCRSGWDQLLASPSVNSVLNFPIEWISLFKYYIVLSSVFSYGIPMAWCRNFSVFECPSWICRKPRVGNRIYVQQGHWWEKKTLQCWSRGMFSIVSAGGHIDYWQPLYR